jgi:hypothetical protein
VTLAACGDDDDDGASATTVAPTTTAAPATTAASTTAAPTTAAPTTAARTTAPATTAASTTAAAAQLPVIDVVEKDFAFDLPQQLPAGVVRITASNEGAETHHAQFARLNDGVSYEQLFAAFAGGPEAALPLVTLTGGPGPTQPSANLSVTTELPEGQYVVLCLISGADGIPHAAKGMVAQVTVADESNESEAVEGDVQVGLIDFAFDGLPKTLEGDAVIQVTNEGEESHELAVLKLAEGATSADVIDAISATAPPAGPPPFSEVSGFQGIAPGATGTLDLDLEAGNYVALCFIPSPANEGKPHVALGMIAEFSVS